MNDVLTFTNCTYAYIKNDPFKYPTDYTEKGTPLTVETGWHVIPNQTYGDYLTQKQWFELMYKAETFTLAECSCTVQNMIPLTQNASIQGTASFTAFNNTIYALGYTDHAYETVWNETDTLALWEREGVTYNGSTATRYEIPQYNHIIWCGDDLSKDNAWPSYFWDPMVLADELLELRPGKNAIKFAYTPPDDIWQNTCQNQMFDPNARPSTSHDSIYSLTTNPQNNILLENITPHSQLNTYVRMNDTQDQYSTATTYIPAKAPYNHITIRKPDIGWRQYQKPCPQWFVKMIPIFDDKGSLIHTTLPT